MEGMTIKIEWFRQLILGSNEKLGCWPMAHPGERGGRPLFPPTLLPLKIFQHFSAGKMKQWIALDPLHTFLNLPLILRCLRKPPKQCARPAVYSHAKMKCKDKVKHFLQVISYNCGIATQLAGNHEMHVNGWITLMSHSSTVAFSR